MSSLSPVKRIRLAAWIALGALALGTGGFLLLRPMLGNLPASLPLSAEIGGPFELTTHDGKRLSSAQLEGKPFALFFGYTYCPDVCPTTLLDLSTAIGQLGPDADRIRYLFVSVDPERDTPEHLKVYLSNFDPRIVGLTGTPAEIAAVAKAYRAFYEKVPGKDGNYTYNHQAAIYLMGKDGRFAGTMNFQESEDVRLKKLRRLLGS
jgi:protein SCO1/2